MKLRYFLFISLIGLMNLNASDSSKIEPLVPLEPVQKEVSPEKNDPVIKITTKDNPKGFEVNASALMQFPLLKTMLEEEKEAREIPLSLFEESLLKAIFQMNGIANTIKSDNEKKAVEDLLKKIESVKSDELIHLDNQIVKNQEKIFDVYNVLNYLSVDKNSLLYKALMYKYFISKLHAIKDSKNELEKFAESLPNDLKPILAKLYFLKYGQEIDLGKGVDFGIPLMELYDWGRLDGRIKKSQSDSSGETGILLTDLHINNLDGLSKIITDNKLNNLRQLHLGNNRIVTLGNSLHGLTNLQALRLENNRIVTLGNSLHGLKSLFNLILENNRIVTLGNSLRGLNLWMLNLSNNQIVTLDDSLNGLNNLESLRLDNNRIAILGNSFHGLKSLQSLDLSNNQTVSLGDSLRGLNNLQLLILSNNRIVILGNSLHGLNSLSRLDLSNNQIVTLGDSLNGLNNFHLLNITGNPIVKNKAEIEKLRKDVSILAI